MLIHLSIHINVFLFISFYLKNFLKQTRGRNDEWRKIQSTLEDGKTEKHLLDFSAKAVCGRAYECCYFGAKKKTSSTNKKMLQGDEKKQSRLGVFGGNSTCFIFVNSRKKPSRGFVVCLWLFSEGFENGTNAQQQKREETQTIASVRHKSDRPEEISVGIIKYNNFETISQFSGCGWEVKKREAKNERMNNSV